jgi:hypothetical protein
MVDTLSDDSPCKNKGEAADFSSKAQMTSTPSVLSRRKSKGANKPSNTEEQGGVKPIARSYFGLCHFEQHIKQVEVQFDNFKGKGCPVCQAQINDGDKFVIKNERKIGYYTSPTQLGFDEFVRKLFPDQNNAKERMIKGCQIIMPETVFFKDGKIEFIVQNDRDWCLAQDVKTKYTYLEVNKKLPSLV